MNASIRPPKAPRKRQLMRYGFCATGLGLLGLLIGTGLLLTGPIHQPAGLAALICGAAALVVIGFGIMVVAADPFADDERHDVPG